MTRTSAAPTRLLGAVASGAPTLDVVHHCDALTLLRALPSASVDIVVTSPPYNILWKSHTSHGMLRNNKWLLNFMDGYDNYSDNLPEAKYQQWIKQVVIECMRVSKGLVWVNHKTRYRDGVGIHPLQFLPFPLWSEVVWNRMGTIQMNHNRFAPSHEYVFGFGRPHFWDKRYNTAMSVWDIWPSQNKDFPCSFPEDLITPLIKSSCPDGGIVLDPFMGSGTTALVAHATGRHYIGCDISPKYVQQARKRLADTDPYQPTTLSTGDKQLSLFEGLAS